MKRKDPHHEHQLQSIWDLLEERKQIMMDVSVKSQFSKNDYRRENKQQNPKNHNGNVSFTNAAVFSALAKAPLVLPAFKYMKEDPIIGLSVVDLGSMIGPRTAVDMKRNPQAGIETFVRESSGLVVHCLLPGFIAVGISSLMTMGLNKEFGVKANKLLTDNETVDIYHNAMKEAMKSGKPAGEERTEAFVRNILSKTEGLNDDKLYKAMDSEHFDATVKKLTGIIHNNQDNFTVKGKEKEEVMSLLGRTLKGRENVTLVLSDAKRVDTSAEKLLNNLHYFGKTFNSKKVNPENIETLVKKLKSANNSKTILGLATVSTIAFSVQAINRRLTKMRTGQDGFVGYSDFGKDGGIKKDEKTIKKEKQQLKMFKAIAALGMAGIAFATLGPKKTISGGLGKFMDRMQFKGLFPSTDQLKVIYATSIIGRILASSDKNELRETSFRDYLGFTNWLVLGGFVTKAVAQHLDKGLINDASGGKGNKYINWISKKSVKTFGEIADHQALNTITKEAANVKNGKLILAETAGLVYSGVALGFIVPKINDYMTKKNRAKEKAAHSSTQQQQTPAMQAQPKTESITSKIDILRQLKSKTA